MYSNSTNKRNGSRHTPKPSSVSWKPLSQRLSFFERSPCHSGRPSLQQVPALRIGPVYKQLINTPGALLKLAGETNELEVMVAAAIKQQQTGNVLSLAWEADPEIGETETIRLNIKLEKREFPLGIRQAAICPHCQEGAWRLLWTVTSFACSSCLGIRTEAVRGRKGYTLERRVRRLRERLGIEGPPLSPIIVNGKITPRRRRLAAELWEQEMALLAGAINGGLS